jgi:ornithine carbamoyltransferase
VAKTLERYVDAIVARVFDHQVLVDLADAVSIPVINALSDAEHPCQALADLQVLREHLGDLRGKRLVFVGDGNNVAASLVLAGASVGMHVRVVCPPRYAPDRLAIARAQALGTRTGALIEVTHDPEIAAAGADAVYTDVWASMGQEDETEIRRPIFLPYRVTRTMLAAAPEALVLHCLPAHRGEEIDADVLDGERSIVFDQAENRLWAQMAVMSRLIRQHRPGVDAASLGEPTSLPVAIASRSLGRPGPG